MRPSSPHTRSSLILRLHDPRDDQAWEEFVSVYEPWILDLARRAGLQESDARDVGQQVLAAVSVDVGHWRPDGKAASFRRWLFTIARNRMIGFLAHQRKRPRAAGGSTAQLLLENQPAGSGDATSQLTAAWRRQLFLWAAARVRPRFQESTWSAFWRTSVEREAVAEVAAALGMSVGAVYVARSRVMARLREAVQSLTGEETFEPEAPPSHTP